MFAFMISPEQVSATWWCAHESASFTHPTAAAYHMTSSLCLSCFRSTAPQCHHLPPSPPNARLRQATVPQAPPQGRVTVSSMKSGLLLSPPVATARTCARDHLFLIHSRCASMFCSISVNVSVVLVMVNCSSGSAPDLLSGTPLSPQDSAATSLSRSRSSTACPKSAWCRRRVMCSVYQVLGSRAPHDFGKLLPGLSPATSRRAGSIADRCAAPGRRKDGTGSNWKCA
jgi:hypothetical protein